MKVNYLFLCPSKRIRVKKVGSDEGWRSSTVRTDGEGMYWRILVPGAYDVQAYTEDWEVRRRRTGAGGRTTRSKEWRETWRSRARRVVVPEEGAGGPVWVSFRLR